jgi:hypothetical protein
VTTVQPVSEQLHVAPSAHVMVQPPPAQLPIVHVAPSPQCRLHCPPEQFEISKVDCAVPAADGPM